MRNLVIDLHADTMYKHWLAKGGMEAPSLVGRDFHVSKVLLEEGGVDIQVMALWTPVGLENSALDIVLHQISLAYEMIRKDELVLVRSRTDLDAVREDGRNGIVLSIEGAEILNYRLHLLPIFYELGVRLIGLAWSRKNIFCEGVQPTVDIDAGDGISNLGEKLVEAMMELGMIIDVSHLNRHGFEDIIKKARGPIIASHSCAYGLRPHKRNLTDDQLRAIAGTGGLIGVNFNPPFLVDTDARKATVEDIVAHIRYISDVVGPNHVALGSDFDGIASTPEGCENASKIRILRPLLLDKGFSEDEVAKIMGENVANLLQNVLPLSSSVLNKPSD